MNFSPFSALYQNIAATMVALGLTHTDEAAFKTWAYSAWIDSGFTPYHCVLSQPETQLSIQFNVRVAASGHKVNVWWGDGTSDSYTPGTGTNTSCAKTYGSTALRPVVVIGRVSRFESTNTDGKTAFGGRMQGFRDALAYLYVIGSNTLSGSVAGLTALTLLQVQGSNTLSGSVAGLTGLTYISVSGNNTLTGSVAGLTGLTYLSVSGSNTLSGSVAGLTGLTLLFVGGNNTLTGSVAGLTDLTLLFVGGNNTLTGWETVAASATGLCYLYQRGVTVLTSTQVNAALAGFWANRDAVKPRSERTINLTNTGNGAPTGQGLVDKAALQAYKSPNNTGPVVWTVTTN